MTIIYCISGRIFNDEEDELRTEMQQLMLQQLEASMQLSSVIFVLIYILVLVLLVTKPADEDVLMICLNTVHR